MTVYGDDPTYHNYFAQRNVRAFFGFSSITALTDYVIDIPIEKQRNGFQRGEFSYRHSYSMLEALRLARNGWSEGVELAQDYLDMLDLEHAERKRRTRSVAGGRVNVGRMLTGQPDYMIRRTKQPGHKIVTLFVEAGLFANIETHSMIMRAAMITALVDLMERNGYSCNIVALNTSTDDRNIPLFQMAVTLKSAGERLNLSDICFGLGHPSYQRRLKFAVCASINETREIWASQGKPANAFDNDYKPLNDCYHVPVLRRNIFDVGNMFNAIKPERLDLNIVLTP